MSEIIDEAYQRLVDSAYKADPRLGDLLIQKYEKDREDFLEAIKAEIDLRDKTYWAKHSCKRCYGSGIMGTSQGENVYCSCISKNFMKWIPTFRKEFLEKGTICADNK